jgi:C_GCAxxG_C_C family probable redox protein
MTTGFAGGIGGSKQELCGALSGGTMLIGALYGRTDGVTDDKFCQNLSARHRERFVEEFSSSRCEPLREQHPNGCSPLVERAALLLLELLEETEDADHQVRD